MTIWSCSFAAPNSDHPELFVAADTAEEAALSYHNDHDETGFKYRHETVDGIVYIRFATIGVRDINGVRQEFVTRIYHHGLWRKGGVKRPGTISTLVEIAKALGYTHDPQSLVAAGWDLEESMPEAQERQIQRYRAQAKPVLDDAENNRQSRVDVGVE